MTIVPVNDVPPCDAAMHSFLTSLKNAIESQRTNMILNEGGRIYFTEQSWLEYDSTTRQYRFYKDGQLSASF